MSGNIDLFTTRMRKATRKIHSVSDALVNAKFAICKYSTTFRTKEPLKVIAIFL